MRRYALRVHGMELEERLDATLPAIWADPFQLQQVLLNLVGNAEQALRGVDGEKRITVTSEARGSRIVVTVSDSGPGIPAAELDRVFNPFYTTKAIGKGTGLGLSVSDGIIREHGGSIRVESRGRRRVVRRRACRSSRLRERADRRCRAGSGRTWQPRADHARRR